MSTLTPVTHNLQLYQQLQDRYYQATKNPEITGNDCLSLIQQSICLTKGFIIGHGYRYADALICFNGVINAFGLTGSRTVPHPTDIKVTRCAVFENSEGRICLDQEQIEEIVNNQFFGFGDKLVDPILLTRIFLAAVYNLVKEMESQSSMSTEMKVATDFIASNPEVRLYRYNIELEGSSRVGGMNKSVISLTQGYLMGLGYDTENLHQRILDIYNKAVLPALTNYSMGVSFEAPDVGVVVKTGDCYFSHWKCHLCEESFGGLPLFSLQNSEGVEISLDKRKMHYLTHGHYGLLTDIDPVAIAKFVLAANPVASSSTSSPETTVSTSSSYQFSEV